MLSKSNILYILYQQSNNLNKFFPYLAIFAPNLTDFILKYIRKSVLNYFKNF
jgi:hypothetical protein